jgi:hypothetical protein
VVKGILTLQQLEQQLQDRLHLQQRGQGLGCVPTEQDQLGAAGGAREEPSAAASAPSLPPYILEALRDMALSSLDR